MRMSRLQETLKLRLDVYIANNYRLRYHPYVCSLRYANLFLHVRQIFTQAELVRHHRLLQI